jgi:hypothetical protein
MSIRDDVKKVLGEGEDKYRNQAQKGFAEHYQDLIDRGIIKKKRYEIPPIDTIGKRLFRVNDND